MMHLSAFMNLTDSCFKDGVIQRIHKGNELSAFCTMSERVQGASGEKMLLVADRGTLSWNTMAHAETNEQFYLMRCKDVKSQGSLLGGLGLPDKGPFDVDICIGLVRSRSSKLHTGEGPVRFVAKKTQFDFLEYGSQHVYT